MGLTERVGCSIETNKSTYQVAQLRMFPGDFAEVFCANPRLDCDPALLRST